MTIAASRLRFRKNFSSGASNIDKTPNLIGLQKSSYNHFLQLDVDPQKRKDQGLESVLKSVFPIHDFNKTVTLEYVSYKLDYPESSVEECIQRDITYASPLSITVRLIVFDIDEKTKEKSIRDIKEQQVYMGDIPLMTEKGSFVVNGTERVVVSQLHRSPGVLFSHDSGRNSISGKLIYSARIIPYRGSWIDFEFDQKDIIYAKIDRRRKFPVTILLRALGYSEQELLSMFYDFDQIKVKKGAKFLRSLNIDKIAGQRAIVDILNPKNGELIVRQGRRITRAVVRKISSAGIKNLALSMEDLIGRVVAEPIVNIKTGEVIAEVNSELDEDVLEKIVKEGIGSFSLIFFDGLSVGPYFRSTLLVDKVKNPNEAILDIYKRMRPGDSTTLENAKEFFRKLFFSPENYDLSEVGRLKLNHRLSVSFKDSPVTKRVLSKEDIILVVKMLVKLRGGGGFVDDIDHLGNRRVRSVGELVENQFRVGLVRMGRAIRERMSIQDIDIMMPHDLLNSKPVNAVIKEFFCSSPLSQFMDQTNPLSEITHKRRLSALGPGGLSRDRAGFEVRDVHPTHYGRICPIETPEGPNIGLISSLATYARINKYGFIETPYRVVKGAKKSSDIQYMSSFEEQGHFIGQASDYETDKSKITCRINGEYEIIDRDKVSLMDVSPGQLVSIAASLIPFLEHDDANRALMGSNMQRQAVPLLGSKAPLIGTGIEKLVATDSCTSIVALNDGVVEEVDASRIVVRRYARENTLGTSIDIYDLVKYKRTNQDTCFNQKPTVKIGDIVRKNDIIADGPSTELGELALGKNILVALMPWMGYNFEDSILISERMIKDDVYTSVHIEEIDCVARDTKLGREEITRDIANVSEDALKNLDSSGIIAIGSKVSPGNILVGKVTPKGETQLSPEEKLLMAIFGEKASDMRDTSLRVSPGSVWYVVIDVQVYSREYSEKDERLAEIIEEKTKKLKRDFEIEENIIKNDATSKLKTVLVGKKTSGVLLSEDGNNKLLEKNQIMSEEDIEQVPFDLISYTPLSSELEKKVSSVVNNVRNRMDALKLIFENKIAKMKRNDELPPGVIKIVKVSIAKKRKLQVGDKFAGRHGNKGVISKIVPVEDMLYLPDGTPLDMVLNPLGVPSRMNIGQLLECHLGWASYNIWKKNRSYA